MRVGPIAVISGGLIVAATAWAAAAVGSASGAAVSTGQKLSILSGGFPDPDLLDGSKEKPEERSDYGMLGQFDIPGQKEQQAANDKNSATENENPGAQKGSPDGSDQKGGGSGAGGSQGGQESAEKSGGNGAAGGEQANAQAAQAGQGGEQGAQGAQGGQSGGGGNEAQGSGAAGESGQSGQAGGGGGAAPAGAQVASIQSNSGGAVGGSAGQASSGAKGSTRGGNMSIGDPSMQITSPGMNGVIGAQKEADPKQRATSKEMGGAGLPTSVSGSGSIKAEVGKTMPEGL